jgi:integrase
VTGEIERLIAASGSVLLPAVIGLAIETAMRRSEIISLRWEHIDLKRRVAHLPATKNGSARDVPLSSRAVAILQKLKGVSLRPDLDGNTEETEASDLGRVFAIRSDAVTRAFERAVTRARKTYLTEAISAGQNPDGRFLTDLRFHDLRHEATTRLASIFPMHELAKITGHKDPRMLMRYYHPKAEDLAKNSIKYNTHQKAHPTIASMKRFLYLINTTSNRRILPISRNTYPIELRCWHQLVMALFHNTDLMIFNSQFKKSNLII